jgi:hypothetical protein
MHVPYKDLNYDTNTTFRKKIRFLKFHYRNVVALLLSQFSKHVGKANLCPKFYVKHTSLQLISVLAQQEKSQAYQIHSFPQFKATKNRIYFTPDLKSRKSSFDVESTKFSRNL